MDNLAIGDEGINFESFILNELKNLNSRFEQVLDVIANDRIHFDEKWESFKTYSDEKWDANDARWDANDLKWIANDARWDANDARWDANDLKWIANDARWDANDARWDANDLKWIANDARWDANDARWEADVLKWEINDIRLVSINSILDDLIRSFLEFKKDNLKFDEFMRIKIGAIGARWGVATENSYRSMLESILMKSFNVEVQNFTELDESGIVFGRPDQIELDIIIKNGILIIIELKSSVSKNDLYIFERKVKWYESKFDVKVNRAIVVSPMVDRWAIAVAEKLKIELFSNFDDLHFEFSWRLKTKEI
ncbi:MAG: DUF3782 domain-containing protein [Bacteroidetes bacterium]|nr:DUF3782 domain-containing protein [Bacteroidota bacterium]